MKIDINPCTKPRQTRADKWLQRPAVLRYRAFADELRLKAPSLVNNLPPRVLIAFYIPMPPSWSQKKKESMNGKPHTVRPDWDNLAKAAQDALCEEDGYIHDVHVRKLWSYQGMIEIDEVV